MDDIEMLGELQFLLDDVKIIVGKEKLSKEEMKKFRRGQLKAEAEIRKVLFTQAKQGSAPAQKEFIKLIRQREYKNNAK